MVEFVVTVVPFVALWLLMLLSLRYSWWLCPLLAVPAAGFLVRLFVIQHDCLHLALGRRLGVVAKEVVHPGLGLKLRL